MRALVSALLLSLAIAPAFAEDEEAIASRASDPAWKEECGSCHVAYPPRFLPATSWRRLMGGLERHFGVDASLDAATADRISRFLADHAGRGAPPPGAEPRITATRWFRHEHRKTSAGADCTKCHTFR